jgi:O-antigen ligase
MDRERIDKWCEWGIFGLVLAILIFGPSALGGVLTWHFLLIQALTATAGILWVVRIWIARKPVLLCPPICYAMAAFVAYAIFRYSQTEDEYMARLELIKIVDYALLFMVALNNLHRQELTNGVAFTLIFLGMTISAYAIYQFVTHSDLVEGRVSVYGGRAGGTFYDPNNLAEFLELLIPLGLAYVLVGRISHGTKIMIGYASLVMLGGVVVSVSRGGMIATAATVSALCLILLFQRHFRIQALILLLSLAGVAVVVAPRMEAARQRFEQLDSVSHISGDLRIAIWRGALAMWREHFWLGVGPGEFDNRYPRYRSPDVQGHPDYAHDDYLNTLAEYGVAGSAIIATVLILLYAGVIKSWKFVRIPRDEFARRMSNRFAFLLGSALGVLGVLIHSGVEFPWHVPGVAVVAVTSMALLAGHLRFATERYWLNVSGVARYLVTVVLAVAVGYLSWTGVRGAREYRCLMRASRDPIFSPARITDLTQAWKIDPANAGTTYAIAECYRVQSWNGGDPSVALAKEAMEWFRRGMKLNPYEAYNWLEYGMCVDWIGTDQTTEDSTPYFQRAVDLDPLGQVTSAYMGWHQVQTGDYAAAQTWFQRSIWLQPSDNEFAQEYLGIVQRRMLDYAKGTLTQ